MLRLSIAAFSVVSGIRAFSCAAMAGTPYHLAVAISISIGVLLVFGFLTPIAAILSALMSMGEGVASMRSGPLCNSPDLSILAVLLMISASLVLLGPGAFSVDAHLFGRREIIIPARESHHPRQRS